jgi:glycosyltransferase involved in cell wall biosynthesis
MKILIIHCRYQQRGGEDFVVEEELKILNAEYEVEALLFQNEAGWKGALSMILYPINFGAANKVRKRIRSFQPDIIHLHNFHYAAGPLIIRTAKSAGIPVVMTLHNFRLLCPSATLYFQGEQLRASLSEKFPWTAVRKGVISNSSLKTFWVAFTLWIHRKLGTFNLIDTYIALNQSQEALFLQSHLSITKDRILVKPNFCPAVEISNATEKGQHFLYIGRLSEEKGILTLLNAFVKSSATVKIAGTGPLEDEVIRYSKLHDNIIYLGELSKHDVASELSLCSALIFSSVWPETFGLVIIEAFSMGTPVIASQTGAAKDLVQDQMNGLHFEPGNADDLTRKIEYWQQLPVDVKKRIAENAYQTWRSHYTPEVNLELLESIYKRAINTSKKAYV